MKKTSFLFSPIVFLLVYPVVVPCLGAANKIPIRADKQASHHRFEKDKQMRLSDLPATVRSKISQHLQKAECELSRCEKKLPSGKTSTYRAINRKKDMTAYFTGQDIFLIPNVKGDSAWHLEMALSGYGYRGAKTLVRPALPDVIKAFGNRIEYQHGALTEWYVNDEKGFEQGVTLRERPAGEGSGPLVVEWTVSGSLVPRLEQKGVSEIIFYKGENIPVIRYSGIKAWDVTGRSLPVKLTVRKSNPEDSIFLVSYVVDDTRATYPVMIDPLFTPAKKILPMGYPSKFDHFGYSVSIDGDTVVVGANGDDDDFVDSGSVYIFDRNQDGTDNWGQVKKINASPFPKPWNSFGCSVSISGNTLVVGAYKDKDDIGTITGSAYIFYRNQDGSNNWGQVAKITAFDAAADDGFGNSVSISGDTIVVGAYGKDEEGADSGSAYIFYRDQGGDNNWGYVKKITASDAAAGDYFGYSTSIDGDTIVVGAYGDGSYVGSAYIFDRDEGDEDNWGYVKKITASDAAANDYFGLSVSISGNTVVVGAEYKNNSTGSAYIFERDAYMVDNSWDQVKKIIASDAAAYDHFGISVSISSDTVVIGASSNDDNGSASGSAYIFERDPVVAENWSEVKKITASDGRGNDLFAHSVSVSGNTVVSGAYKDDDYGSESGSAYIFDRDKGGIDNWGQIAKITAGDGSAGGLVSDGSAYDKFGVSVSVSGDTMVVGAYNDDDNGSDSGSAYILYRNHDGINNWGQVKKITASDSYPSDYFGYSVFISGNTLVVGAYGDDDYGNDSGSAYIFDRDEGGADNWGQVAKIIASDAAAGDYFGYSTSIDGNTVVVGAYRKNDNAGLAYVFERPSGGWADMTETTKIIPDDGAVDDYFGHSVSISGDTILVGAYGDDYGSYIIVGSAYLFYRNEGGNDNWGQKKKLFPDPGGFSPNVYFGYSVSISGDTAVVGAYWDWHNFTPCGSAYIFERNAFMIPDIWARVQKITPDNEDSSQFGYSVSVSGDTILVGAYMDDENGVGSGSAYVFDRDPDFDSWSEVQKITAVDAAASDHFGNSVSISGDTMVIGAYNDDDNGSNSGSAYVYIAIDLCEGDFNSDGDVDGSDLALFAADFGRTNCDSSPHCKGDFDSDNDVDGSDLATFAADFGRTDCPTP